MRRAASTPLGQVLGGGAAHSGTHHWWMQRLSAVALLPLTTWFIIALLRLPDLSWASVHAWLAGPWSALAMVMLVLSLCWHSHLGVQVVIEDYIHGAALQGHGQIAQGDRHGASAPLLDRLSDPFAARRIARDHERAAAGAAEDEAGLDDLGRDDERLGPTDVLLQPGHVRIAQEVRQRLFRLDDQFLLVALRLRRGRAGAILRLTGGAQPVVAGAAGR